MVQVGGILPEKDVDQHGGRVQCKGTVDRDRAKVDAIVKQLTVDPSIKVHHRTALCNIAAKLNKLRNENKLEEINFHQLRQAIDKSNSDESMLQLLWNCPGVREYFLKRESSSNLEDLLVLSSEKSPLTVFPPDINSNLYCDLILFGLDNTPGMIFFLLNLLVKNEKPVQEKDVVRIAFFFSSLAHAVSRNNNALAKTKTLLLQSQGLTIEGRH